MYEYGDIFNVRLLSEYDSGSNPSGILGVSTSSERCVIAFPANQRGFVHVVNITDGESFFVSAHTSDIAAIAVSSNGTRLATASEKVSQRKSSSIVCRQI